MAAHQLTRGEPQGLWKQVGHQGVHPKASARLSHLPGEAQEGSPQPLLFPQILAPLATSILAWINQGNCKREVRKSGRNGDRDKRWNKREGEKKR